MVAGHQAQSYDHKLWSFALLRDVGSNADVCLPEIGTGDASAFASAVFCPSTAHTARVSCMLSPAPARVVTLDRLQRSRATMDASPQVSRCTGSRRPLARSLAGPRSPARPYRGLPTASSAAPISVVRIAAFRHQPVPHRGLGGGTIAWLQVRSFQTWP